MFIQKEEEDTSSLSPELRVIVKRLNKKDATTKFKALEELQLHLKSSSVEECRNFMPFWPALLGKLSSDVEKRTRESCLNAHRTIATKLGRLIAPQLKEMIGPWLCAHHDPSKEVARAAIDSFDTSFPSKRVEVFNFCQVELISFLSENILKHTPETLSDPRFVTEEEMAQKYSRVVSTSVLTLASLYELLSDSDLGRSNGSHLAILDSTKFWSLSTSGFPDIRSAMYCLIKTLAGREDKALLSERVHYVGKYFVSKAFTEDALANVPGLWEAILLVSRAFPNVWTIEAPAAKFPKAVRSLFQFLRNGVHGSGRVSYPALLLLLLSIPDDIITVTPSFALEFISSLWIGTKSSLFDRLSWTAFFDSYFECILFFIKREISEQNLQSYISFELDGLTAFLIPQMTIDNLSQYNQELIAKAIVQHFSSIADRRSQCELDQLISLTLSRLPEILSSHLGSIDNEVNNGPRPPGSEVFFNRLLVLFKILSSHEGATKLLRDDIDAVALGAVNVMIDHLSTVWNDSISPALLFLSFLISEYSEFILKNTQTKEKLSHFFVSRVWEMIKESRSFTRVLMDPLIRWVILEQSPNSRIILEETVSFCISSGSIFALSSVLEKAEELKLSVPLPQAIADFAMVLIETPTIGENINDVRDFCYIILMLESEDLLASDFKLHFSTNLFSKLSNFVMLFNTVSPRPMFASISLELGIVERILTEKPIRFFDLYGKKAKLVIADVGTLALLCDQEDEVALSDCCQRMWLKAQGQLDLALFRDDLFERFQKLTVLTSFKRSVSSLENMCRWVIRSCADDTGYLAFVTCSPKSDTLTSLRLSLVAEKSLFSASNEKHLTLALYIRAVTMTVCVAENIETSKYLTCLNSNGETWVLGEWYKFLEFSDTHMVASNERDVLIARTSHVLDDAIAIALLPMQRNPHFWHVEIASKVDSLLSKKLARNEVSNDSMQLLFQALRFAIEREEHVVLKKILRRCLDSAELSVADSGLWIDVAVTGFENDYLDVVRIILDVLAGTSGYNAASNRLFKQAIMRIMKFAKSDVTSTQGSTIASLVQILTAVIRLSKSDENEVFEEPVILAPVLKNIRSWFSAANGISITPIPTQVVCAVLRLLSQLVTMEFTFELNMASFVTDLTERFVMETSCQDHEVLICAAKLLFALLAARVNQKESWASVEKIENRVHSRLLSLFIDSINLSESVSFSEELFNVLSHATISFPGELVVARNLEELLPLLDSRYESVQKSAFRLIKAKVYRLVEDLAVKIEMKQVTPEEFEVGFLSPALLAGIKGEDDFADFAYFLKWTVLFCHFECATFDIKASFVSQLKTVEGIMPSFLNCVFETLGVLQTGRTFDISKWDIQRFEIDAYDTESDLSKKLLAAHLYLNSLKYVPNLVRSWWTACKNRQIISAVEAFTEKCFSPLIISAEFELLSKYDKSSFEEMSVKLSRLSNEVTATYSVDESTVNIVVKLPSCFPLRYVEVDSGTGGRIAGITESKWRGWLLSISIMAQNATIFDSLNLFRKSMKNYFDGVEDCSICYAVVGVIDRSLPSKTCRTCKNCFHAACLYKWFKSSNQSSCPLCRAVF